MRDERRETTGEVEAQVSCLQRDKGSEDEYTLPLIQGRFEGTGRQRPRGTY